MGGRGALASPLATGPERLAAAAERSGDGRAGAERGLRGGRAADMTAPPEGGKERAPGTGKLQLGGCRGRWALDLCGAPRVPAVSWTESLLHGFRSDPFLLEWIDCLRIP